VNNGYTDYSTKVTVNNPPMSVIDNGANGWSTTGAWTSWSGQGYDGDVQSAAPITSTNGLATAAWAFNNLPAGSYLVYATWSTNGNRAANAPYTVTVGGGVTNVAVDQQAAPSVSIPGSGPAGGVWSWCQLGASAFTVGANGTLVVELSNADANGYVVADAVMIVDPPKSAASAAVVQGGGAKAAAHDNSNVQAADAVLAAWAQSPGATDSANSAASKSEPWWLLYGGQ
jgi:hypothetical protein